MNEMPSENGARVDVLLASFVVDELLEDFVEIGFDENLLADGMIDSLGMVRLVAFIEEKMAVAVPPEDFTIENFQTINRICEYLDTLGA